MLVRTDRRCSTVVVSVTLDHVYSEEVDCLSECTQLQPFENVEEDPDEFWMALTFFEVGVAFSQHTVF